MIITIAGIPGSGKSTVAKAVAKELNFNHYSVGDRMGEMAQEKGISIMELSKQAEEDRAIDDSLDSWQEALGQTNEDFVIDSRLGFHVIKDSLKVFLTVDAKVGAERIFKDMRPDEKENVTLEQTHATMLERVASEKKRYKEYYGIEYDNPDNFDVVIDTTTLTVKQVVDKILEEVRQRI